MVAPRQRERINSPHELKRKLESSALRAIGVAGETAQAGDSHIVRLWNGRSWREADIRRSAGVEGATIGRSHKDALCAVDSGGALPPDWRAAQLHSMDA
jgi:hypothetical protein